MKVGEAPRTIRIKDEAAKKKSTQEEDIVVVDKILSMEDVMKLANPNNPVNPDNLDITGSFEEEVNIPKMSAADVLNMTQVNDEEIEQPLEEEEEEYDPSTLEINPLKDSRVQESQAKDTTKIPESTARLYTKEEVEDLVKSQAGAFWANYLLQIKGVKTNQQVYRTAVRELIEFSKVLLQTLKEGRF